MVPWSFPTPTCLLDTVDYKRIWPEDVLELVNHPVLTVWRDQELAKRLLKPCIAEWAILVPDRGNAPRYALLLHPTPALATTLVVKGWNRRRCHLGAPCPFSYPLLTVWKMGRLETMSQVFLQQLAAIAQLKLSRVQLARKPFFKLLVMLNWACPAILVQLM